MAVATVGALKFEIEGFDHVVNNILQLAKDVNKVNEIRKILRRQAMPAKRIMVSQAPRRKPTKSGKGIERTRLNVKYHRTVRDKKGNKIDVNYKPGNLKRSIKLFNGKNKEYPTVYVGAEAKKAQGSGYYSWFVQHGTSGKGGIKNTNDFVGRSNDIVGDSMGNEASEELMKYIKRKAVKLGFETV